MRSKTLQHVLEVVAVGQLARAVVDHVAALGRARHLGDGEQRLLRGVAEDREDRHARPEVDGVVAPFPRGDPHAVEIQQPGQLPPVEGDDPAPGLLVGQTVQIAHGLTELLQMPRRFAKPRVGGYEPPPKLLILLHFRELCVSDRPLFRKSTMPSARTIIKAWWKRWGTAVVVGAVVVVVAVTGMVGYRQYDASQRAAGECGLFGGPRQDRTGQCRRPGRAEQAGRERAGALSLRWPPSPPPSCSTSRRSRSPRSRRCRAKLPPELVRPRAGDRGLPQRRHRQARGDGRPSSTRCARPTGRSMPASPSCRRWRRHARATSSGARELWTTIVKDPASPQGAQQRAQAMLTFYGPAEGK